MAKRIFAWIMLAGFVMLILNLIVFRYYWQLSMAVYLIIFFAFIFTSGKLFQSKDTDEPAEGDNEPARDADQSAQDAEEPAQDAEEPARDVKEPDKKSNSDI